MNLTSILARPVAATAIQYMQRQRSQEFRPPRANRSDRSVTGVYVMLLIALISAVFQSGCDSPRHQQRPPNRPVSDAETTAADARPETDVVYYATPRLVVDRMLEMADIKEGDILYDLGCGDGRILVAAAKKYGVKAHGFDIDPDRVKESLENAKKSNVEHLVTVTQADIFELDLREATVVMLYLLPDLNVRLMPQLEKLKPGSRIISHSFDMRGAKPAQIVEMTIEQDRYDLWSDDHTIYKWVVPWENE